MYVMGVASALFETRVTTSLSHLTSLSSPVPLLLIDVVIALRNFWLIYDNCENNHEIR